MTLRDKQDWAKGSGVISHTDFTTLRILRLVDELEAAGICTSERAWQLLLAADRICSMGMWLTVHMTYARQVYLDGRILEAEDFKSNPEGHTGGALNIVPAYVGYLLANALTGKTRAWLMGQGHSVAAIEAINCLLRNLDQEQATRYTLDDSGLSQLCQDFYGYRVSASGKPEAPLGSHVGVYTAGGISEGGYLGFAELQYVHMPLPGQELVTFLSDGAFEEQRGSDWSPRWWRGEDTGLVMPIMIANGRRIDQRTTMAQSGGVEWLEKHLRLNGFSPIEIDGRDPAAFAWAILTMGSELSQQYSAISQGKRQYPVQLPYTIAETVKGYGFPGAGTNSAHNLPLSGNPNNDLAARHEFNEGAARLFIGFEKLNESCAVFSNHKNQRRELEKDHCLRYPRIELLRLPEFDWCSLGQVRSPMEHVDIWFQKLAEGNPEHRFRIGNPDEMRSNRMNKTLDFLQHRVVAPEPGVTESLTGSVITALNEEAVVSAALANKQGVNLVVSYEAFAVKMLGAMRQEAIFCRHFIEAGRPIHWLSVPVVVTSHTWENGKNEQSHQDPTLSEAWLGEMADVAPVMFPIDANTSVASLARLFTEHGKIATVVIPKGRLGVLMQGAEAETAVQEGMALLRDSAGARIQLIGVGAYQVHECLRAAEVLRQHDVECSVMALLEPGKFRIPRDQFENRYVHSDEQLRKLIPEAEKRVFVTHTRAEVMIGVLRRLDGGREHSRFLGYANRGGTLDTFGMLYANGQTWAHILKNITEITPELSLKTLLDPAQLAAVSGSGDPDCLR